MNDRVVTEQDEVKSNANYGRQTIANMTTSIKGDVRTSRQTNVRCQGERKTCQDNSRSSFLYNDVES